MSGHTSPWLGRRVLVADCTHLLGSAVARALLDRGAVVAGFVRGRGAAPGFVRDRDAGRFFPLHGPPDDAGRLRTALAVHEASAAFHPDGTDPGADALCRAAGPPVAVVVARPAAELRLAGPGAGPHGVARFGEVFGPGDRRPDAPFARAVNSTPADGPARDFVFARDAARACLAVAEAALAGGTHDATFRTGWELTERQVAALVGGASADPAGGPGDNPFGWRPETTLDSALAETAAWYREFLGRPAADARPARRAA